MKISGTGLIQQIPYNYDLLNKLAGEKNQSLRNLKINLEVIEYFPIFVLSLKHYDRKIIVLQIKKINMENLKGINSLVDFVKDLGEVVVVKYLGVVIGYTYDGEKIEFLDNEHSKEIQKTLSEGHTIGLSSRRMGTVGENGYVNYEKITEYNVINRLDEIINSKQ